MVRKLVRYGLKAIGIILGFLLILWAILLIYITVNKKKLIGKISSAIQKRTHGDVKIGGLSVSFIRTFPILSLQLTDVELRDSLYYIHHKNLLKAENIYLRASIPGLIFNNEPVGRVIIRKGEINIVTDTLGNTNEYVLKSERDEGESFNMPDLVLQSVLINYINPKRKKHYHAIVRSLKCRTVNKKESMLFHISMNLWVKNISFNTIQGAYLKEKHVDGNFDLVYKPKSKDVFANHVKLNLGGHPFYFHGQFNTDKNNGDFTLDIATKKAKYSDATSFLTERLQKKLNDYSMLNPIDFEVKIAGKTNDQSIPLVIATMTVKNNKVITPKGVFENCSFNGVYSDERIKGKKRVDENSYMQFRNFTGTYENIVIKSKNILISNLVTPFLECDVQSNVDMESLNTLAGSSTIQFAKGKMSVNILYKGSVMGKDSIAANINGTIRFNNVSLKYLPRNFQLSDCDGLLKFMNNDLFVDKLTARAGKTKLVMNGSAKNFLSMLDVSPEKLVLDWKITSPVLHIDDFKGFLSKPASKKLEKKEARFTATASKVDKMFSDGDMYINLETPLMEYKTFTATDVKANVILKPTEINFQKVELKHAKGSMEVTGSLRNGETYNPVTLRAVLRNMDVPLLFTAFQNFGQDAVTNKNLKGKLSANINFNAAINNNADLMNKDSEGTIYFLLEDGELNNFEPLLEISRKAFKKQDFSQIRFANLKNKLDVKGTSFIVNPMDIRSTALNFSVEGVYDFKKGTDMSIKFPVNNLTRSQAKTDLSDDGKARKGLSLRLRAKTGDDGKLKISWDPFGKSIKKKEEVKDSAEARK